MASRPGTAFSCAATGAGGPWPRWCRKKQRHTEEYFAERSGSRGQDRSIARYAGGGCGVDAGDVAEPGYPPLSGGLRPALWRVGGALSALEFAHPELQRFGGFCRRRRRLSTRIRRSRRAGAHSRGRARRHRWCGRWRVWPGGLSGRWTEQKAT